MTIPSLVKNPAAIAVLSTVVGFAGSELRQRTATELAIATLSTRVNALEQRSYVSKDEFLQFSSAVLRALDDVKAELRTGR
jgi:hypothetical protein